MKKLILYFGLILGLGFLSSCNGGANSNENKETQDTAVSAVNYQVVEGTDLDIYANVELKTDISHLSANEREMLKLMFKAADLMEDIYWKEAYGNRDELLNGISDDQNEMCSRKMFGRVIYYDL